MNKILLALADESVLLMALVTAVLGAVGAGEKSTKVVLAAVPLILAVIVRSVTTKPSTLTEVAVSTARSLDGRSSGATGTVTTKGEDAINTVVSEVGGLAGKLAPAAKEVLG